MSITVHQCSQKCDGMPHTLNPVPAAVRDATATAQESKPAHCTGCEDHTPHVCYVPPAVQYATVGQTVTVELPWSEVCMSMRIAGRVTTVTLIDAGDGHVMAQIHDGDGRDFSFPVLPSEAGFYRNTDGWYFYPPAAGSCGWTCTDIGLG